MAWDSREPASLSWRTRADDTPMARNALQEADQPYFAELAHFLDCLDKGCEFRGDPARRPDGRQGFAGRPPLHPHRPAGRDGRLQGLTMAVRMGLCSLDHLHAMSYLACLAEVSDIDLVGIWDNDRELREATAQRFNTQACDSLQDLLERDLDGVVICSANARHREHVEAAASHTPHILCEKPIATSAVDGQAMIDVCQAAGAKLQIAFPVRFAPAVAEAKRMLDANRLGRVYSAACTNQGFNPGRWFVDREQSGGGAVIDHTVHVIDLLRWFWNTEVVEVFAEIGYGFFRPGP